MLTLRQACALLLILLLPRQVLWKLGWGLGAPSCPPLRANGTERRLRIDRMDRHAADADFEPDARCGAWWPMHSERTRCPTPLAVRMDCQNPS